MTILFPEDIFRKPGSVGVPFIGMEVKVVDDEMREMPLGESGEIIVRSYRPGTFGIMKAYYKDPGANRETFWGDWIRTGDLGKKDEEGHFYVLDRKKDMIISGGFNIYSKEVESVLEGHPKILEAAVVGIPDEAYGEAVKAFVVLREAQEANQEEIIAFCRSKMASYKKPKVVQFVGSLPRGEKAISPPGVPVSSQLSPPSVERSTWSLLMMTNSSSANVGETARWTTSRSYSSAA